jgi:hypothetical protein
MHHVHKQWKLFSAPSILLVHLLNFSCTLQISRTSHLGVHKKFGRCARNSRGAWSNFSVYVPWIRKKLMHHNFSRVECCFALVRRACNQLITRTLMLYSFVSYKFVICNLGVVFTSNRLQFWWFGRRITIWSLIQRSFELSRLWSY